jgi:hypothetical protein
VREIEAREVQQPHVRRRQRTALGDHPGRVAPVDHLPRVVRLLTGVQTGVAPRADFGVTAAQHRRAVAPHDDVEQGVEPRLVQHGRADHLDEGVVHQILGLVGQPHPRGHAQQPVVPPEAQRPCPFDVQPRG